jgi:putative two-component system response regulator
MGKILIVDDQPANVELLEAILDGAGYKDVLGTTDPREVVRLHHEFEPDLILLDLMMPHMDGFAVMSQLAARIPADEYLPVLVLTADITPEARARALSAGAKDFVTKPLDHLEVLLRIRNLLETRQLHVQLAAQNRMLDERVRARTKDLEDARIEILDRLALAAEYRDDDTGQHTLRVGIMSARIAECLDQAASQVELMRRAAPLHDVGKIGIPDAILLKPGKLTPEEWRIMQTHATVGTRILRGSEAPVLQLAEQIALCHHERWDGTGYPTGASSEDIPLAARIVAVADVFDALTHDRPYKTAWPQSDAIAEIRRQSGIQFDPAIVGAFLSECEALLAGLAALGLEGGGLPRAAAAANGSDLPAQPMDGVAVNNMGREESH